MIVFLFRSLKILLVNFKELNKHNTTQTNKNRITLFHEQTKQTKQQKMARKDLKEKLLLSELKNEKKEYKNTH